MTDQTGPARQDSTERCTCGHTRRDHSGRRDHREKYGPTVAGRPWCHACETECIYCPPDPAEDAERMPAPTGYCLSCGRGDVAPSAEEYEQQRQRAEQAEAAIARVRAVIHVADTEDVTDWQRGFRACSVVALGALAEPAVAAAEAAGHTYLSTGCLHGHHDYCQAMTGHAGAKRPGQCKFCAAPCLCSCHQSTTDQPTEA